MTHAEFVAAYAAGKARVEVDSRRAARLVSARMMLPLILLPFLGIAVALALAGYLVAGIALFVAVVGFRFFVRRSSRGFVLARALQDARFYDEALAAGVIRIEAL